MSATNTAGQIRRESVMGEQIYELVKQAHVKTVVEIGTWNGRGSTRCIRDAIIDSGKTEVLVFSLEADLEMYRLAVENNLPSIPNFHFIHGRIVDHVPSTCDPPLSAVEQEWLIADLKAYSSCSNVLWKLPESIDVLILDGGEFTSEEEFRILGPRSRNLVLDDTNSSRSRKLSRVRDEILANNREYDIIVDNQSDRNGWMHVRRTARTPGRLCQSSRISASNCPENAGESKRAPPPCERSAARGICGV